VKEGDEAAEGGVREEGKLGQITYRKVRPHVRPQLCIQGEVGGCKGEGWRGREREIERRTGRRHNVVETKGREKLKQ